MSQLSQKQSKKGSFVLTAVALTIGTMALAQSAWAEEEPSQQPSTDEFSDSGNAGKIESGSTSPISIENTLSGKLVGLYLKNIQNGSTSKVDVTLTSKANVSSSETPDWHNNNDNSVQLINTGMLIAGSTLGKVELQTGSQVSGGNGLVIKRYVSGSNFSSPSGSTIDTLNLSGTITGTGFSLDKNGYDLNGSAVILSGLNSTSKSLTTVNALNVSGTLTSNQSAGIAIGHGVTVKSITVTGTIKGGTNAASQGYGIYHAANDNDSNWAGSSIGKISSSGTIYGSNTGIYLSNANTTSDSKLDSTFSGIEITSGSVTGGSYGIYLKDMKTEPTSKEGQATSAASIHISGGTVSGGTGLFVSNTQLTDITVSKADAETSIKGNSSAISLASGASVQNLTVSGKGSITGTQNGISVDDKSSIASITLSGTATQKSGESPTYDTLVSAKNGDAIFLANTAGQTKVSIQNAKITAGRHGIVILGTVSGGFSGTNAVVEAGTGNAIQLGTVDSLTLNTSTISSQSGVGLLIDHITGEATLSGGSIKGKTAGLYIAQADNNLTLTNETISGGETGLYVGEAKKNVSITGSTITGDKDGLYFGKMVGGTTTLSGGSVTAGTGNAITYFAGASGAITLNATTISSTSGNGLVLQGTFGAAPAKDATNFLTVSGATTISGSATNGAGILITGSNTVVHGNISVEAGSKLQGHYGLAITEGATVSGSINISGTSAGILNQGTLTGNLTVANGGSVGVVENAGKINGTVTLVGSDSNKTGLFNDSKAVISGATTISGVLVDTDGTKAQIANEGTMANLTVTTTGKVVIGNVGTLGELTLNTTESKAADYTISNTGTIASITTGESSTSTFIQSGADAKVTGAVSLIANGSATDSTFSNNGGTVGGTLTISGSFANLNTSKAEGLKANVYNNGTISNTTTISANGTGAVLVNDTDGHMKALSYTGSGSLLVVNKGEIGGDIGLSGSNSTGALQNDGTITGKVSVAATADSTNILFANTGSVTGAVTLNAGTGAKTTVFSNGGTITGGVAISGTLTAPTGVPTISNNGKVTDVLNLTSATGTASIVNGADGRLEKGITFNGDALTVSLNNQGYIGGDTLNLKLNGTKDAPGFTNAGTIAGSVTLSGTNSGDMLFGQGSSIGGKLTVNTSGDFSIQNAGDLKGGLELGSNAKANVVNTGTIGSALSYTATDGSKTPFVNEGTIGGAVTIAGSLADGALLSNSGTISGGVTLTTTGAAGFINAGTIKGNVSYTGAGSLTYQGLANSHVTGALDVSSQGTNVGFTNLGTIDGNVSILDGQKPKNRAIRSVQNDVGSTLTNRGTIGGNFTYNGSQTNLDNTGTIKGGITYAGTGTTTITVADGGSVGANAGHNLTISEASGNVKIGNWPVSVSANKEGQNVASTITVSGSGKVSEIQTLTITSIEGTQQGQAYDFSHVVSGAGTQPAIGNVRFSQDLENASLSGTFDPETNTFKPIFNTDRSSSALLSRTYVSQIMRRDFFIDAALTEEAAANINEGFSATTAGQAFVKPYAAHSTYDLSGVESSGNTFGVMAGTNIFLDKSIVTVVAGYEHANTDGDLLSTKMNTGYVALNGVRLLTENDTYATFAKVVLKGAYSSVDIERTLSATSGVSSADTKGLTLGATAHVGVNYRLSEQGQLIPAVGLGYSYGQLDDFTMANSTIADSYEPGSVNLGYANVSLSWNQAWSDRIHSMISGGVRLNFNKKHSTVARISDVQMDGEYTLPGSWEYVNAAVSMKLTDTQSVSLGYTGVFDSTGATHSGVAKWMLNF